MFSVVVEDTLVLRNNPGFASAAVASPLAVSMCLPVASAVVSVEDWQAKRTVLLSAAGNTTPFAPR